MGYLPAGPLEGVWRAQGPYRGWPAAPTCDAFWPRTPFLMDFVGNYASDRSADRGPGRDARRRDCIWAGPGPCGGRPDNWLSCFPASVIKTRRSPASRAAVKAHRWAGPATCQRIRATLRSVISSYLKQHTGVLPARIRQHPRVLGPLLRSPVITPPRARRHRCRRHLLFTAPHGQVRIGL